MFAVFVTLAIFCLLQGEVICRTNLAFNKTTRSSEPYYSDKESGLAVNGIIGQRDESCFIGTRRGWLAVDLGRKFKIHTVIVHGRVDGYGSHLKSLVVRLSPTFSEHSLGGYDICNSYKETVKDGEKMVFICKDQLKENQFVIIGPQGESYFYICEIEVYEREFYSFGCFEEVVNSHTDNNSSLYSCLHMCQELTKTFAAFKDGKICVCNDYVNRRKPSRQCDIPCEDSSTHFCGGKSLYSVYTVCDIGYYGRYCQKRCHCRDRMPCNRNGECNDVCQSGWKGKKCDQLEGNPYTGEHSMIGCFEEAKGFKEYIRDLGLCGAKCSEFDFHYFGKKGDSCYCLEEISNLRNTGCQWGMTLYYVCLPGSYGDFCLDTCHCSSGLCSKNNGTCLAGSGCSPGWKGPSCNVRDCNVKNGECDSLSECQDDADVPFCKCTEGYEDLRSCQDVDECELYERLCGNNSNCHNTQGSFRCECIPGYSMDRSASCLDIDECDRSDTCDVVSTECHNTIGSYSCECRNGFNNKSRNYQSCADIDECSFSNGGCDQGTTNCTNTIGSFECVCKDPELVLNATLKFCQVRTLSTLREDWRIPLIISIIIFLVIVVALLAIIFGLHHMRRMRKRFTNLTSTNETSHALKESSHGIEILLENLEDYLETQEAEIRKEFNNALKQTSKECKYGSMVEVKPKNRFKNILPYDHNRVVLNRSYSTGEHSNYINASLISEDGTAENANYIAAQGPSENSLEDFWIMLWQENVDAVVMLTLLFEEGKNKCTQYWPESNDEAFDFGQFSVTLESEEKWPHFIARKLNILNKESQEIRNLSHYQYKSWADKGVPDHIESLLHLRRKVVLSSRSKILVHCSAGVGRTGTFLAIHFLLNEAASRGSVDFLRCLKNLRMQRPQMIQNLKQYMLVHQAILLYYKIGNTSIPAFSLKSFRNRLKELNQEDEQGMNLIKRQYKALQEETQDREPSVENVFMCLLPNNIWHAHYFPGLRKPSTFVAGILPDGLTTVDVLNIISQPGSIALCFEDSKNENALRTLLPAEDEILSLANGGLKLKYVDVRENIRINTYMVVPNVDSPEAVYSNMTSNSREFSVISVPYKFRVEARLVDLIWRSANSTQNEGPNYILLLGNSPLDVGIFMAAVNIFEMVDFYQEANIFQVALDLLLVHPSILDMISYSLLHALAEQYVLTKYESRGTQKEDEVYSNLEIQ